MGSNKCANTHICECVFTQRSWLGSHVKSCAATWTGVPEVPACVLVPHKWYLHIKPLVVCKCVWIYALTLHASWQQRPCQTPPPSAIYVFAQPCNLTLSKATSTLGHVTRQAEICAMPCIPRCYTHTHRRTPPLITHNSHLASFKTGQLFAPMQRKSHQQIPHSSRPSTSSNQKGYKRRNFQHSWA